LHTSILNWKDNKDNKDAKDTKDARLAVLWLWSLRSFKNRAPCVAEVPTVF